MKLKELSKKTLEGTVEFIRFNLLYPKLGESFDHYSGDIMEPKGMVKAQILDPFLGMAIGSQVSSDFNDGVLIGAGIGLVYPFVAYFLGSIVVDGINYLKNKNLGSKQL